MKEQLKIEIVAEDRVTPVIEKIKHSAATINQNINKSISSSTSVTKATQATSAVQTQINSKIDDMTQKLQSVKGFSFKDMFSSILASNAALALTKIKLSEIQSMEIGSKMFDDISAQIDKLKGSAAQGKGFTVISKETMNDIVKLRDLQDEIAQFDFKNMGDIQPFLDKMEALGVSAEGTAGALKGAASAGAVFKAALSMLGTVLAYIASILVFLAPLLITIKGVMEAFKVSKLGDEIYHLAHRFNMGTEAFQEWKYIMEQAGGTVDNLEGFMETLASEQAAVIEGSEDAAANFKRLGLAAEEVAGMRQQELFEETVRRIQQIGDETERAAISYSIFGDEASKFMNVLNMSNEEMAQMVNNYHMLGGGMSGELLEASNKLQGSIHNLKQAWQGVSNTLAEAFIPIAQKLVEWLTKVVVVFQLFLKVILGVDLRTTGAGNAMDSAAGSANKYSNSIKKATKAAEDLKRTTMGFDELNIVSNPNSSSSDDSSSSALGGIGDIGAAMPDMSSLNLDGIYAWFEEYKGVIAQITTWSLLLIGIILAVIGCMTANVPMALVGFGMAGLGIMFGIKSGAFAEFWEGLKKVAKAAADWVVKAFNDIVDWFKGVGEAIGKFFVDLWNGFIDGCVNAWNAAMAFIKAIPGWIYTNILQPIGNFFVNLYTSIKNGVVNAWNGIVTILSTVGTWIYDKIIAPVGKFFTSMWDGFKSGASKAWEGIKSVFGAVADWFKNIFTKAWEGVKAVFSTGGKIFDGIKDGIANVFKTVVNGIIGGINKVIAVPFNAINALLNKIRDVSVAGIEPFKGLIKYNALSVPQIPQLATGGIVTGSTLANIGEAGKEAVLPLENNTEWMDLLADRIAARNSAPTKVVLQVGEKELGWATINGINNITKQTGNIQLVL